MAARTTPRTSPGVPSTPGPVRHGPSVVGPVAWPQHSPTSMLASGYPAVPSDPPDSWAFTQSLPPEQRPVEQAVEEPLVYTMRDLNQGTARVMNEIQEHGAPAFITKHGRFVAMITPIPAGQIESRVLAAMAQEIEEGADE